MNHQRESDKAARALKQILDMWREGETGEDPKMWAVNWA
jgi:hypothetical protein